MIDPVPQVGGSYHRVITTIVDDLFAPETKRLNKNIGELVKRNNQLRGQGLDGFLWNGDWYAIPGLPASRGEKKSLHIELEDAMRAHKLDADMVGRDKHQISQILFKVMSASMTVQVLRDSLPNSVVNLIPALKAVPRVNEEGCCFILGSKERKQFDKIAPKIDQYAAGKFFY